MLYDELRWKENAMLQILNDQGGPSARSDIMGAPEATSWVRGTKLTNTRYPLDVLIARSMCIFALSVINY